jgi:hypothetical protein
MGVLQVAYDPESEKRIKQFFEDLEFGMLVSCVKLD